MSNTRDMTRGTPWKLLLSFALPLMLGNVFQQMYTVVDTAIVGRGVGLTALAALGTVDWLNWMFLGIAQGFSQGFSVRIAQKYGQQDYEGMKAVMGVSTLLSAAIAVVGVLVAQAGLPVFLTVLQVPGDIRPQALLYSRIILGGFPAVMFFNFCASCLRAVGNSKTPLYAMVAASVTNIVLDCVTVFVLDWGIAGAATATVFSQCLAGTVCAIQMSKTPQLQFERRHIRAKFAFTRELMHLGSPIAGKNIVIALGGMVIQTVVNGFQMSFIAGFTATNKLYGLLEIAAISYGYAVTTYVGQNYGAIRFDRIRQGMRSAAVLSVLTSFVICAVMILFGRQITMLFISSEDIQLVCAAGETAYRYLCTMSVMLPCLYLLYVFQAALHGIGNTLVPMISAISEFVMRVTLAALVVYLGGQEGIFLAEISAWMCACILLGLGYRHSIRKLSVKNATE